MVIKFIIFRIDLINFDLSNYQNSEKIGYSKIIAALNTEVN